MPLLFSPSTMFLKKNFAHENMKKTASKVAKPAHIQPKSQFLFHKNLPPRDFSIMTLLATQLSLSHKALYKTSQTYCFRTHCHQNKTFEKSHVYEGLTEYKDKALGPKYKQIIG